MLQLRKAARVLPIVALMAAVLGATGCDDDDSSTSTQVSNADVAGDWTMISFQIVPQPALTPPTTTGELHLTLTDYRVLIVLNNGSVVDTALSDSGTYEVSGSSWSQTSSDPNVPQAAGTASLIRSGATENLVVDVTAAGVATHSIWTREQ